MHFRAGFRDKIHPGGLRGLENILDIALFLRVAEGGACL